MVVATWLGAGRSGFPVSAGAGDFSSLTKMTIPALGPTYPSIKWVFCRCLSGRSVQLTAHLHLALKIASCCMSLWAWAGTALPLPLPFYDLMPITAYLFRL